MGKAIAQHAEAVFLAAPTGTELGATARPLVEQIITSLVSAKDTRQPRSREAIHAETGQPEAARAVFISLAVLTLTASLLAVFVYRQKGIATFNEGEAKKSAADAKKSADEAKASERLAKINSATPAPSGYHLPVAVSNTVCVVTIGPFTRWSAITRWNYPGGPGVAGMSSQHDQTDSAPCTRASDSPARAMCPSPRASCRTAAAPPGCRPASRG